MVSYLIDFVKCLYQIYYNRNFYYDIPLNIIYKLIIIGRSEFSLTQDTNFSQASFESEKLITHANLITTERSFPATKTVTGIAITNKDTVKYTMIKN